MKYHIKLFLIVVVTSITLSSQASVCKKNLTLDRVLTIVKENHPVIKTAVIANRISDAELLSAQGAFDVNVNASAYYNRYNSSSEIGQPQYVRMFNSEVELLTRYGLLLKSGVNLNDGDIKTPISPTGDNGEYFISLNAPLFRGAGYNTFSIQESLSEYNIQQVYNNYRLVALELLLKTIHAYWEWVAAKNKLNIEQKLLSLSEFRLEGIEKRAKNGDIAAIDITEVKQEIQTRKSRVIKAERAYQKVSYELSWFLWDQKTHSTQNVLDCKADDFKSKIIDKKTYNTKNGKITALKRRPEIKHLEISKMITELERDFAENDLLPRLDIALKAGKQYGEGNINGAVIKGGFEFELPIQRREAKGRVQKYNLTLDKIDLKQRNIMQKIFLQVEDAVSAINFSIENLQAIIREVKYAEKMQEGESKRFNLGDSSLFVVNRRERATAEAKIKLIESLYEYNLAIGYYKAVTGQLI